MLRNIWIVPLVVAGLVAACESQHGIAGKGSATLGSATVRGEGRNLVNEDSPPPARVSGDREVVPNPDDQPGSAFSEQFKRHTFRGDIFMPHPFSEQAPILL